MGRVMLSKVPEVTVWFWVIKILCTTVGESFADWINMTLGVGLVPTALIFTEQREDVTITATLRYQACTTDECFRPARLTFTLPLTCQPFV